MEKSQISTQDTEVSSHSDSARVKYDYITADSNFIDHRTKIICTMGPSCWDPDKIVELLDAGMNVARLNFSHGDHKTH